MGRLTITAVALLAAALTAASPASPEAETSGAHQHFQLVRTTTGPASFEFIVDIQRLPGESGLDAFEGGVALNADDDGVVQSVLGLGATTFGKTTEPNIHVNGDEVSTCEVDVCHLSSTLAANTGTFYSDSGGPEKLNRFYFIFENADVDVRFEGDGWVLAETELDYRYVDYRDAEGVGVSANDLTGFDLFLAAEAAGGTRGSIGQAMPPCSNAKTPPAGLGVGTLTLTGGRAEPSTNCPTLGQTVLEDLAVGQTAWRAEGPIFGHNSLNDVRLFVVDLPECNRLRRGIIEPDPDDLIECPVTVTAAPAASGEILATG